MSIHDWTKVDAGIFHAFHHDWITEIARILNRTRLPREYYALPEQLSGNYGPDVLTLQGPEPPKRHRKIKSRSANGKGGIATQTRAPKVRFHITDAPKWYAGRKKSVVVHHVTNHRVVAVVEIVSPGNKSSRLAIDAFARKTRDLIAAGVHLMLIDLFPPTSRDPEGIHPVVWGEDDSDTFRFDRRKPLTCVSYIGGLGAQAFVQPVAVGDVLPEMPIFLTPMEYVAGPLEASYQAAFDGLPDYWQDILDGENPE
jgi:hypothetical protein